MSPQTYEAAALLGEREVYNQGEIVPAAQVLQQLGMEPLHLHPKEGLAIMNGTAVMTAVDCLAYDRERYLAKLATRITSMVSVALRSEDGRVGKDVWRCE